MIEEQPAPVAARSSYAIDQSSLPTRVRRFPVRTWVPLTVALLVGLCGGILIGGSTNQSGEVQHLSQQVADLNATASADRETVRKVEVRVGSCESIVTKQAVLVQRLQALVAKQSGDATGSLTGMTDLTTATAANDTTAKQIDADWSHLDRGTCVAP